MTSGTVGWRDTYLWFGWLSLSRGSSPIVYAGLRFMIILPPVQEKNVRVHMIMNKITVWGRLWHSSGW